MFLAADRERLWYRGYAGLGGPRLCQAVNKKVRYESWARTGRGMRKSSVSWMCIGRAFDQKSSNTVYVGATQIHEAYFDCMRLTDGARRCRAGTTARPKLLFRNLHPPILSGRMTLLIPTVWNRNNVLSRLPVNWDHQAFFGCRPVICYPGGSLGPLP